MMLDDFRLATKANRVLEHFNSTPHNEHSKLLRAYFDGSDVVVGVRQETPNASLEKFVMKGRQHLKRIARRKIPEYLKVTVIPVRCVEEAMAMSEVFGDRPI